MFSGRREQPDDVGHQFGRNVEPIDHSLHGCQAGLGVREAPDRGLASRRISRQPLAQVAELLGDGRAQDPPLVVASRLTSRLAALPTEPERRDGQEARHGRDRRLRRHGRRLPGPVGASSRTNGGAEARKRRIMPDVMD